MDGRHPSRAPPPPHLYAFPKAQVQLTQQQQPIQQPAPLHPYTFPQTQVQPNQQQQPLQQPAPQNEQLSPEEQATEYRRARRLHFQNIALSTVHAINNNIVDVSKTVHRTRYYPPDAQELANWMYPPKHSPFSLHSVKVSVAPMSTLQGVRFFHNGHSSLRRIGVLNFANATHPGGGFLEGARAQEESIARSSSLYVALTTDTARPFYALHDKDEKGGFYSHAMIYSPNVHIFRDDAGEWVTPHQVDVLTSPAVNAGKVRKVYRNFDPEQVELSVQQIMHERIARILALFERKGAKNLVLGSFGTGVFRNDVRAMAKIWKKLLLAPGARFGKAFETIVFCLPDDDTRKEYEKVFHSHHARPSDGRD